MVAVNCFQRQLMHVLALVGADMADWLCVTVSVDVVWTDTPLQKAGHQPWCASVGARHTLEYEA